MVGQKDLIKKSLLEQKSRFSDAEFGLIKNTFAGNMKLLIILRKVFLQIELTKEEQATRLTTFNKDVCKVIRKLFLPEIEGDEPLHQVTDLWGEAQIAVKEQDLGGAIRLIESRARFTQYMNQQLIALEGVDDMPKGMKFKDFDYNYENESTERIVKLLARQEILKHIESNLMQTLIIAGTPEESEEEMIKRIYANSNK